MTDTIDYADKFRHLETPVKGSLDPCRCHTCVCEKDDLNKRELTAEENEAVDWIFDLVRSYNSK